MSPSENYLDQCTRVLESIRDQNDAIQQTANIFASRILGGHPVHLFGSGHSRIMVEEMWPRYGSFPGFNPIVELSLTYHHDVVGPNGQRQAMFLENVPGFAARILRNFDLSEDDAALVISSGGTNIVPVEIAEKFREVGMRVVVMVSQAHCDASEAKRPDGKKLTDFADVVLDTGAPAGDACVKIEGLEEKVSPLSSVGGCMLINAIKAEVAGRLISSQQPPTVLAAANQVGPEKAAELFESAYDQHARQMAKLYQNLGS